MHLRTIWEITDASSSITETVSQPGRSVSMFSLSHSRERQILESLLFVMSSQRLRYVECMRRRSEFSRSLTPSGTGVVICIGTSKQLTGIEVLIWSAVMTLTVFPQPDALSIAVKCLVSDELSVTCMDFLTASGGMTIMVSLKDRTFPLGEILSSTVSGPIFSVSLVPIGQWRQVIVNEKKRREKSFGTSMKICTHYLKTFDWWEAIANLYNFSTSAFKIFTYLSVGWSQYCGTDKYYLFSRAKIVKRKEKGLYQANHNHSNDPWCDPLTVTHYLLKILYTNQFFFKLQHWCIILNGKASSNWLWFLRAIQYSCH